MRALSLAMVSMFAAALSSCATLGGGDEGDPNLPNAGLGPFRVIAASELGNARVAPNAQDDSRHHLRDAAVLDADGDPATPAVWGYFAANTANLDDAPGSLAPPDEIVRCGALDGRSFDRSNLTVLTPADPWEGGTVGAPSVLRAGGRILLYYAAKGGIGVASASADGAVFTREAGPVLAPEPASWEAGATPASPGVVVLPDGSFRMFYEVATTGGATSLGEARSSDGIAWVRVGSGPALAPSPRGDPNAPGGPFDDLAVGSPFAETGTTQEGTPVVRVYYAARDSAGGAGIGLSGRFGDDGPLIRAASLVFGEGSTLAPREPWVLSTAGYRLLFVTQREGPTPPGSYAAVAVGVTPALITLPPPLPK